MLLTQGKYMRPLWKNVKKNTNCYLFTLPTILFLGLFSIFPFLWAFALSLFRCKPGQEAHFVGLENFIHWLTDPVLIPSMLHMFFLAVVAVFARVTVPIIIARIIYGLPTERSRHFYRVAFLLPMMFPFTAILLVWASVIYGDTGLLNQVLTLLGKEELTRGWLSNPRTALAAIAFLGFPFAGGFEILIYYAGFTSIPESVREAAVVDGAGVVQKFFSIEIPMVLSQIRMLIILAIIGAVQGFEAILILTSGGPTGSGGPGFKTMVPGLWMYINAFLYQNLGYACSIGVFLFVLIMGLTVLNLKVIKSTSELQRT